MTVALHVLYLQLSPPLPSSLAPIKLANPGSPWKMAVKMAENSEVSPLDLGVPSLVWSSCKIWLLWVWQYEHAWGSKKFWIYVGSTCRIRGVVDPRKSSPTIISVPNLAALMETIQGPKYNLPVCLVPCAGCW